MANHSPTQSKNRRVILQVFVSDHCWQCPEARALAAEMQTEFPALAVRVVDIDQPGARKPAAVFSVPTFLLNGKIVSLGTPARDDLLTRIQSTLDAREGASDGRRQNAISAVKRTVPRP